MIYSDLGFTLAETLITVLIFSAMAMAINAFLLAGNRSFVVNRDKIEIQQDLRIASDWIKEDLRKTSSTAVVDVPTDDSWYTSITFRIPSSVDSNGNIAWPSETIEYVLGGTNSTDLQRIIVDGASTLETRTIAENISFVRFRRLSTTPQIVDVSIKSNKTDVFGNELNSQDFNFKVEIRN